MRRYDAYKLKRGDNLGDTEFWNKRFEDIDLRIAAAEDTLRNVDAVANRVESLALDRLNNVLTPLTAEAIERLTSVSTLFEATSVTPVTIGEGERRFTVPEGQRLTFAPLAYLVISPTGDLSRYMAGRTVSYSQLSGELVVDVMRAVGEGDSADWQIAPMAFVSELEALSASATAAKMATAADRAAVALDKTAVANDKAATNNARDAAILAKNDAQAALATFLRVYRGPLSSDPPDGEIGHFYFDTSQQMAKVYTSAGWSPLFSLTLGGIRQGEIAATEGQTVFNVGAFTFMNVWLNGVKLAAGVDFTVASPNVTLTEAANSGDQLSYLGYYATGLTDFYSKEAADGLFLSKGGSLADIEDLEAARDNLELGDMAVKDAASAADISAGVSTDGITVDKAWDATEFVEVGNISGAYQFDLATGSRFRAVLTGNATIGVKNAKPGQAIMIELLQDGTGGRTVSWQSGQFLFPDNAAPLINTGAGGYACIYSGVYNPSGFMQGTGWKVN